MVSVQNDRGTSYAAYLNVLNEIRAAYNQMRNEYARHNYGFAYKDLPNEQKQKVRNIYPLNVSEAEPSNFDREPKHVY